MNGDSPVPEYALRPDDVWNDYELKTPDNQLAGFFSTYWTDLDDISLPENALTAEFVRYAVSRADDRPSAVYSGVARPTARRYGSALNESYDQLVTLAHEAKDTPVISYSQGDISAVETIWTASENTECVAVTEAGCAGYFDNTLTLVERRDKALIRTSIKPGYEVTHMNDVFAHGFQAVVRNRIAD
jgi:hypothetical protein